jgi:hypothetical protein
MFKEKPVKHIYQAADEEIDDQIFTLAQKFRHKIKKSDFLVGKPQQNIFCKKRMIRLYLLGSSHS